LDMVLNVVGSLGFTGMPLRPFDGGLHAVLI
jgi:hypothetical protein